jgi:hypothetical protein
MDGKDDERAGMRTHSLHPAEPIVVLESVF